MLIIVVIIIIMNIQSKLYTIQFFSLPDDHVHNQSLSSDQNPWISQNSPKKTKLA